MKLRVDQDDLSKDDLEDMESVGSEQRIEINRQYFAENTGEFEENKFERGSTQSFRNMTFSNTDALE